MSHVADGETEDPGRRGVFARPQGSFSHCRAPTSALQASRSWSYCAVSSGPVCSALNEKWASRGFIEGAPVGPGWFAPKVLSLRGCHLCGRRGSWVLGRGARPCVLPGVGAPPGGSHSPSPFRPRFSAPHPFHVVVGFSSCFWVFCFGRIFCLVGVLDFSFFPLCFFICFSWFGRRCCFLSLIN